MALLFWEQPQSLLFAEQDAVAAGAWQTIASYPCSALLMFTSVAASGTGYAEFGVFVDGHKIAVRRSGPDRNVDFVFHWPLYMRHGQLIEVKAIHYRLGTLMKFEAGLFGYYWK